MCGQVFCPVSLYVSHDTHKLVYYALNGIQKIKKGQLYIKQKSAIHQLCAWRNPQACSCT